MRQYITLNAASGAHAEHVIDSPYDVGADARAISVTLHPGGGGSARLSVSCRRPEDIRAGNGDWVAVDFGGESQPAQSEGSALPTAINGIRLDAIGAAALAHISII